ncbi:MAG TPA: transporter substrate-binding domain-containing protein [Spirochaetota bacterium]|nr:transporter substrate-binding domain-containing protein [Spirochaetota bacterium]
MNIKCLLLFIIIKDIIFISTIFAVSSREKLRVVVGITDNRPLMYMNEGGEADGFAVRVLKHIAEIENWELSFLMGDLAQNLKWLEDGKIDMIAEIGRSYERMKKYYFTDEALITSWGVLYSKKGLSINKLEDIENKRIGVKETDFFFSDPVYGLKEVIKRAGYNVEYVYYDQYIDIVNAIVNNEVDLGLLNHFFGEASSLEYDIKKTNIILAPIELCSSFSIKSEKAILLKKAVDKNISELKKDKTSIYYKLLKEYVYKLENNTVNYKWIVLLVILIILSHVIWFIIRSYLKKIIREKTLELEIKNRELEKMIKEKDILIKEIHHRVKNNLQNIISFIFLQRSIIEDEKSRMYFSELQSRIHAIALVHNKLYAFDLLTEINIKDFVVDLIKSLNRIFEIENKCLTTYLDIDDITLNLDQSVPFGLFLNEVITNSYKHGFKGLENPKLSIFIKKSPEDIITVIVKDNGKGFDKDKIDKYSIGMDIIKELAKQLRGDLEFYNEDGAVVKLRFKLMK